MKTIYGKILSLNLCIILLCTLLLGGISIFFLTQNQEKDAEKILSLTTEQLADQINRDLYSIQSATDSLAATARDTLPSVASLQKRSTREKYLRNMEYITTHIAENTDNVCSFYLRLAPELTPQQTGFLYSITKDSDTAVRVPLTDLSRYDPDDVEHVGWYYAPRKAGHAIWMDPYYNENLEIYMISYVIPIYKEGTFLGVLGMDVDFDAVNQEVQRVRPYETSRSYFTSDSGKIYYPPESLSVDNISDLSPELARLVKEFRSKKHKTNKTHRVCTFEYNGVRRILAHSHTINNMNLMLDAETQEIYASRNMMVSIILVAALLIGLVAVLISMQASRRITDPLKQLTIAANRIAEGNMHVQLPKKTDDEVGILTESLGKTVESLRVLITGMADKAYTDGLTHVRNKTSFEITMSSLSQRIQRGDRQFGLLMLDVNNLKDTNDTHGHAVGDEYLLNCCHLICETFRHSPVFRIGGDEFVVLLEGLDLANYRDLIAKMDADMERSHQYVHPQDRISIAKGASFCMPTDRTPEEVLHRADKMMYIDKEHMKRSGDISY